MEIINRSVRLTNEPGGLGLSCTASGLSLASVTLLHKSEAGFVTRPVAEIEALLGAAYGADVNAVDLLPSFDIVARSLNRGEIAHAMIAAVLTKLPELSWGAAARLANAERRLSKYNPYEPRDWRGRWTADYGADPAGQDILPDYLNDNSSAEPSPDLDGQFAQATSIVLQDDADEDEPEDIGSPLEQKYDDLGPVAFAKQVTQFGDRLGREGQNLSQDELHDALAEYNFLQDRLSFWLAYDNKPAEAQANLISAALTLYEGAVNAGIVAVGGKHGDIPQSMMTVAAGAIALDDSRPSAFPGRPSLETGIEQETNPFEGRFPSDLEYTAEGLSPPKVWNNVANNADAQIDWQNNNIKDRGLSWEDYNALKNPGILRLKPGSKAFDFMNESWREAISDKTLDTSTYGYSNKPQSIYKKVKDYIDAAADYKKPRTSFDLNPEDIDAKTLRLAVRGAISREQRQNLDRAVRYGGRRNVSVIITRVHE